MTHAVTPLLSEPVSRETFLLLQDYAALLLKWNKAINLVGKSTEHELWQRHIEDSLQLLPHLPTPLATLADLGSGAGLPGMVIAIARPDIAVTLVEQDDRKSAFLQEVIAKLAIRNAHLENAAIETVTDKFDAITARALAPLSALCAWSYPRLQPQGFCLFPKGRAFASELAEAEQNWTFTYHQTPSRTDSGAALLKITNLSAKTGA